MTLEKVFQSVSSILSVRVLHNVDKRIHVVVCALLVVFSRAVDERVGEHSGAGLEQQLEVGAKRDGDADGAVECSVWQFNSLGPFFVPFFGLLLGLFLTY